jgi:uncharacterized protein YbaR (Trm112 family)
MVPVPEIMKQWLVCPVCKGALDWREHAPPPTVACTVCGRVYPFDEGIPVLLRERAVLPLEDGFPPKD